MSIQNIRHTFTAGGVIKNPEGKIAIVQQVSKRFGLMWSLPKGHIEKGEDDLAAARREIYEEAGVTDLTLVKDLGSYERGLTSKTDNDGNYVLKHIHLFLFTTLQTTLIPLNKEEHPCARFVTPEEVSELLTIPKDKEFFKSIRDLIV